MHEESRTAGSRLSVAEFLSAIEASGVLPAARCRELRERSAESLDAPDATILARRLIKEGILTPFQARRLLKGKKRGLVFGRYVLLDPIGQGARGRVFKARHSLMDRVVALKVVLPDAALSKRSVSRFFREMKIVGRLDHPNVVRALDADEHDGCPYIVMEYLEGQDLERVFQSRGPLPTQQVIDLMAQAARGLAHAHEKGVIHRDVKPTNLFLVASGGLKVLDLGFGDLIGPAEAAGDGFDTDEGAAVGTTDFMAPEVATCGAVDARADLFSLGCTMYRLLAGEYAYPGLTREERLVRRLKERPVPITDHRPELPRAVVAIIDRLLASNPDDRFASATALADALEVLIPGRSSADREIQALHSEPEAPPDWSSIESALLAPAPTSRRAAALLDDREPSPGKGLSSHRRSLEEDGHESGREVHEKYRNELIQMNRVMAELRSMNPDDEPAESQETWAEKVGEKLGDALAEPSTGLIVVASLVLLLGLGLALAIAIG